MSTAKKAKKKTKKEAKKAVSKRIIPFGNRFLVELNIITKTKGGIELPKEEVKSGYIRAIGSGVDKELIDYGLKDDDGKARGLKVGDKVYLPRGASIGDEFNMGDGKMLLVIPPDYVSAIIEED